MVPIAAAVVVAGVVTLAFVVPLATKDSQMLVGRDVMEVDMMRSQGRDWVRWA